MSLEPDVLIVGGGVTGLTAAWRLEQHGIAYRLVEARDRLGGRIHSVPGHGGKLDLGPSWIWPGQPLVAELLAGFGLSYFPQQSRGDIVHQRETGEAMRYDAESPMANAYRIKGGSRALTEGATGGSLIGVIGSIGVSINAAIIIIITALQQDPRAATGDAGAIRDVVMESSRHIVSTTLTTFGGFLPLILGGGGFWPPFAMAIAGGVLLSTVVSFYFVPPVFSLIQRRGRQAETLGAVPLKQAAVAS